MSESKRKKQRYNEKLALIAAYEYWVMNEPPKWRLISHRKWRKKRPKIEMIRDKLLGIPGYILEEFQYYLDRDYLDRGGKWDD